MAIKHAKTAIPDVDKVDCNDWNADHTGTAEPDAHAIDGAKHTSTITENNLMDADSNGLPDDSGLSVADTSDAISKKHTQNTDTALGSGCEAADHGAAATDMVTNICYGIGDPPAANTTTEGTIFIKYEMTEGDYITKWALNVGNGDGRGITTDGTNIWVVDRTSDEAFKYDMVGGYIGKWNLIAENDNSYGITTNGTYIWVTDYYRDNVYVYKGPTPIGTSIKINVGDVWKDVYG